MKLLNLIDIILIIAWSMLITLDVIRGNVIWVFIGIVFMLISVHDILERTKDVN